MYNKEFQKELAQNTKGGSIKRLGGQIGNIRSSFYSIIGIKCPKSDRGWLYKKTGRPDLVKSEIPASFYLKLLIVLRGRGRPPLCSPVVALLLVWRAQLSPGPVRRHGLPLPQLLLQLVAGCEPPTDGVRRIAEFIASKVYNCSSYNCTSV